MLDSPFPQLLYDNILKRVKDDQFRDVCPNEGDKLDCLGGDPKCRKETLHIPDVTTTETSEVEDGQAGLGSWWRRGL